MEFRETGGERPARRTAGGGACASHPGTDLKRAVADADLVVEAAPEKLSVKRDPFSTVDEHAPDHAILTLNTSSLFIFDIAATTTRSEQVAGAHSFNSPVKMDLVDVVYGDETTDEPAEILHHFLQSTRKTLIYVQKDVSGFIVNNVLSPFIMEPAWMVSDGESTIREDRTPEFQGE